MSVDRRVARAGVALLLVSAVGTTASCAEACRTVMYDYDGPATVSLDRVLDESESVWACFGESCEPAQLPAPDGTSFEVPQADPYLDEETQAGTPMFLQLQLRSTAAILYEDTLPIPRRQEGQSSCPGPFTFDVIEVELPLR